MSLFGSKDPAQRHNGLDERRNALVFRRTDRSRSGGDVINFNAARLRGTERLDTYFMSLLPPLAARVRPGAEVTLLIGQTEAHAGTPAPGQTGLHVTTFADLDARLLSTLRPDRIVLPLIAPEFDATGVLARLNPLHYCGQVCVVSRALPDPKMVKTELCSLAPLLDLHLVTLPG